jgi:NAD(P)H-flavin reductase
LIEAGDGAPKPYSIASAMGAHGPGELEIAVARGSSPEPLDALADGDWVRAVGPSGGFRWVDAAAPSVFLAVGTGVSPFRAMLQQDLGRAADAPVLLLFGCRTEADILWHDELRALSSRHPRLRFEPTLSRAEAGWAGRRGHVQGHFAELVAPLAQRNAAIYVCGLSAMVDDCVARLEGELGVPKSRIFTE